MSSISLGLQRDSFQEDVYSGITSPGSNNTFRVIGNAVLTQFKIQLENGVQDKEISCFKARWHRPNALVDRRNPSLIELYEMAIVELGYYLIEVVTPLETPSELSIETNNHIHWTDDFVIRSKPLKTTCKHTIRLYGVGLDPRILTPLIHSYSQPCECPQEYLAANISGVWDIALQFVCRVCGRSYLCECFREAFQKRMDEIEARGSLTGNGSLEKRFVSVYKQSTFRDGICHLCSELPSDLNYCHPMYGSKVLQHYGPYIAKVAIEEDVDLREAENLIRDILGIPRIGEGWISEVELLHLVRHVYPEEEVIHQASPKWLGRQRLDIYLPKLKLAIEYQGRQHYEPVDFFGGESGFQKTLERDQAKAEQCSINGVDLIYFRYDEEITKELVTNRIADVNEVATSHGNSCEE